MKKLFLLIALLISSQVNAGLVFVGQWQVDDGPYWGTQPLAYTGQEAAALLFGGVASDYAISTVGSDIFSVNNMAWYSVIGLGDGHMFAEDYVASGSTQAPGYYYSGGSYNFGDINEAASAYVMDNAQGPVYINYAFRIEVPEPATLTIMALGLAGIGWRRYKAA